jgi:hypothetical protein
MLATTKAMEPERHEKEVEFRVYIRIKFEDFQDKFNLRCPSFPRIPQGPPNSIQGPKMADVELPLIPSPE